MTSLVGDPRHELTQADYLAPGNVRWGGEPMSPIAARISVW
jgi:hypothetical protein